MLKNLPPTGAPARPSLRAPSPSSTPSWRASPTTRIKLIMYHLPTTILPRPIFSMRPSSLRPYMQPLAPGTVFRSDIRLIFTSPRTLGRFGVLYDRNDCGAIGASGSGIIPIFVASTGELHSTGIYADTGDAPVIADRRALWIWFNQEINWPRGPSASFARGELISVQGPILIIALERQ